MADRIKLLPEVVANQIAAGEVVNRPSSVVKEMMENSLDAGAQSVKVNFRDGGKELIQIVDDGCGMSPMDARLAFDRHATSKIRSVEDIYALSTFGFRGEALPSIAAVAQVELRSRQEGDELGTQTEINGGEFVGQTPVMCPVGSQFFVRNLFYNVPARRRFLDKSTTSASHIKSEFRRVALCYPKVAFELYSNDAPIYSLMPTSLAGRIVDIVGKHIKPNLLEVSADTSIASIVGFIGRPQSSKKRNAEQYLFVNGRYFKSGYIMSAILKAYEKLIPTGTQPSFFLYLTIDASRIDVNVHPQKTEVKFSDEEAVWQIVNAAVRETLAKTGAVPMMDFDHEEAVDIPVLGDRTTYTEPRAMSNSTYNPFEQEFAGGNNFEPTEDFTGFDLPEGGGHAPRKSAEEDFELISGGEFEGTASRINDLSLGGGRPAMPRGGFSPAMSRMGVGSDEFEDFGSGSNTTPKADEFEEFVSVASGEESDKDFTSQGFDIQGFENTSSAGFDDEEYASVQSVSSDVVPAEHEESHLDFVQSTEEVMQTELGMEGGIAWCNPMPLRGGLLLAQMNGRLVVVDTDRARERIEYDRYMMMLDHGSALSEQLLFPEQLQLSLEEYALMEEHAVEFASLGFDIDFGGEGAIEVKGTPADIPTEGIDSLIFELLQAFSQPIDIESLRCEKIARVMASKAVRRSDRILQKEEAEDLLRRLSDCTDLSFSPSGKAIIAEITTDELRARLG